MVKLTAQDRKNAIIRAVMPIFAQKGFHGTTTKELAKAAGVSEALLYKHFPSKEMIYNAIWEEHLFEDENKLEVESIIKMKPSTLRLVLSVQYFILHMAKQKNQIFPRLMAQSLLDDGKFAGMILKKMKVDFFGLFIESLNAAKESNDLENVQIKDNLRIWFMHHLSMAILFLNLPNKAIINYDENRKEVINQATIFTLRGIGIKQEFIDNHYDPYLLEKPKKKN